jgi:ATP-binding protein involved in chromosome partitioning
MRIFSENATSHRDPREPAEARVVNANLAGVRAIVAIASAKGGTGKSTLTVNLATAMAQAGRKVALLDADLNAPSVLVMLGLKTPRRILASDMIEPMNGPLGLRIAAGSLLTEGEPPPASFLDEETMPVLSANGHGPVELNYTDALSRLVSETRFAGVEVLLIDLAPGLGELHRIARMVPLTGAIIVTQPSALGAQAVRTALEMTANSGIRVIGLVENMAGFNCDGCHAVRPLMPQGDLAAVAKEAETAMLVRLPFDPRLAECCDRGTLFVREYAETPLAKQLKVLSQTVEEALAIGRPLSTATI